jgi:hypothetical protein
MPQNHLCAACTSADHIIKETLITIRRSKKTAKPGILSSMPYRRQVQFLLNGTVRRLINNPVDKIPIIHLESVAREIKMRRIMIRMPATTFPVELDKRIVPLAGAMDCDDFLSRLPADIPLLTDICPTNTAKISQGDLTLLGLRKLPRHHPTTNPHTSEIRWIKGYKCFLVPAISI